MIRVCAVVENTALSGSEFRAEHGMSWHITTPDGQLLFDTGASGEVMLHNAALLGIDWHALDALALSHAHYDHTGGLRHLFTQTRPAIPLYAHPDLFRGRYSEANNQFHAIGMAMSRDELAANVDLRLSADPVEMLPGVWTTGEITDRAYFEGRSPSHQIKTDDAQDTAEATWLPDPYRDDFSLVLQTEKGLVVLLGCGHAGLLNILAQVKRQFAGDIIAVAGGTHLMSTDDAMLQQAIRELDTTYGAPQMYPCHCTGERAFNALKEAFAARVRPSPAGTVLTF